jgi:hypothetical protein
MNLTRVGPVAGSAGYGVLDAPGEIHGEPVGELNARSGRLAEAGAGG